MQLSTKLFGIPRQNAHSLLLSILLFLLILGTMMSFESVALAYDARVFP